MPIANYTTTIKAEKTVGEIQRMLAGAGASQVLFDFDGPEVSAISFRLMHQGVMVSFRLPANVQSIYVVLQRQEGIPRRLRTLEQAGRVAWRIIKDWLSAQLAIVEAEQAEMIEVFLPYAQNPETGQTLFRHLEQTNFKLLAGPAADAGQTDG